MNTLHILPITKAVKNDNNRCINILLRYMSYIEHDFSQKIKDIFPELIDKPEFFYYLNTLPMQTE